MTTTAGPAATGHHAGAGVATLLAGIVLAAAVLFGLTAGVGAIWTAVTQTATPAATAPSSLRQPSRGASMPGMSSRTGTPSGTAISRGQPGAGGSAGSGGSAPATQKVNLVVDPPPLGGVKGPDGNVHDAFVPPTFTMKVGETVQVTVLNYDAMPHTWTSPALGVNAMVPTGSSSSPSRTTFTIHPTKAGTFVWYCATPCDPWSMKHDGFMRGDVTVVA